MKRRDLFALGAAALTPSAGPHPAAAAPPGYRVTWFAAKAPGATGRVGSRDVTAAGDGTF